MGKRILKCDIVDRREGPDGRSYRETDSLPCAEPPTKPNALSPAELHA